MDYYHYRMGCTNYNINYKNIAVQNIVPLSHIQIFGFRLSIQINLLLPQTLSSFLNISQVLQNYCDVWS